MKKLTIGLILLCCCAQSWTIESPKAAVTQKQIAMLKVEILSKPVYKGWKTAQWDAKCKERGVEHKFEHQLKAVIEQYTENILEHRKTMREGGIDLRLIPDNPDGTHKTNEEILAAMYEQTEKLNQQYERWMDKMAACVKELELRAAGVVRVLHGTEYYIDLDAGNNANDGLAIGTPWLTINKYTTTTVRSAGDIAWVRANTSIAQGTLAADIDFDESGTTAALIEIRGCQSEATQSGYDKWSDASDVLPIVDFEDLAYQALLDQSYWKIENMEFRQSADTIGQVFLNWVVGVSLKNLKISDGGSVSTQGIRATASNVVIENSTFVDCWDISLYALYGSTVKVVNCTFNKGSVRATTYGIYGTAGGFVECFNCSFGQTTAFTINDIYCSRTSKIYLRNCLTNSSYAVDTMSRIYIEDDDGTYQSHQAIFQSGTVSRDTSVTRPGGAGNSLKYAPVSGCTTIVPLWARDKDLTGTFQLYLEADVAKTINIYIRGYTWSAWPTAAQLYCEASYLSNAVSAARTTVTSTQVLTDNTTWTAFTMTMTPARSGIVYVDVKLGLFEAASGVYIDIKPVIN